MIDHVCLSLRQLARADSGKFALAARVIIKLYGAIFMEQHTVALLVVNTVYVIKVL